MIAGPRKPMRSYRTDAITRAIAKRRRDENVAEGVCLNGANHGSATHGRLCRACRAIHRGVDVDQVEMPGTERTHCKVGHELTPENTYVSPKGARICRSCAATCAQRTNEHRRSA